MTIRQPQVISEKTGRVLPKAAAVPCVLARTLSRLDHAGLGTVNQAHMVTARLDSAIGGGAKAQEETTAKE